jgi:hypothetical protein
MVKMEQINPLWPVWMSWLIPLLVLWTIPWKGVALWRAARNNHTIWFIVLLVVNTLAILEIIYIFAFSKKKEIAS